MNALFLSVALMGADPDFSAAVSIEALATRVESLEARLTALEKRCTCGQPAAARAAISGETAAGLPAVVAYQTVAQPVFGTTYSSSFYSEGVSAGSCSSGSCANGQCGASSGRRGLFGRRR